MDSIWSYIFKTKEQEEEATLTVLRRLPIFKDLSKREVASIERILHRRSYATGEDIFTQGVPGAGMYIILSGEVSILLEPGNRELTLLKEGEFFGEMALLDESPRSATARAKSPCIVLGFFQSDLFSLLERSPKLGSKIILRLARIVSDRLKHSNEQVLSLEEKLKQSSVHEGSGA
ncbi:MAG: cyclic nucleotide-binding domain-containing protein [Thermodesulfovibrionales bacterium]|nr:cyclic nucleotide-binding domain-containing protein [Thermodesulfovibrionales bacterium]